MIKLTQTQVDELKTMDCSMAEEIVEIVETEGLEFEADGEMIEWIKDLFNI